MAAECQLGAIALRHVLGRSIVEVLALVIAPVTSAGAPRLLDLPVGVGGATNRMDSVIENGAASARAMPLE